jgi:predicted oxidoreductase (fatty acid repression mutant protein)
MSSPDTMSFSKATHNRRSTRSLQASSPVPDVAIITQAEKAILCVPSAFNSQTTRMTILFGANHKKLWSITASIFRAKLGEVRFNAPSAGRPSLKDKVARFMDAYGTILFWDDLAGVKKLKETSPDIYRDKIEEWAQQSNGMHQYYMWTALGALGLGVNLQHYNPLIDDEAKKSWDVRETWALKAQMVFGAPVEGVETGERVQTLPVKERLQIFGAESDQIGMDRL